MNAIRNVSRLFTLLTAVFAGVASAAQPPITALAFSPRGDSVVIGSQAGLEVRTWPDQKRSRSLETSISSIHDLAFSPLGDVLAVAGGNPSESGLVELFAWPSGNLLRRVESHEDSIYAIAWSADATAWATASLDRSVRLQTSNGSQALVLEGHSSGVIAACFLPDNHTLVTGGLDHSLRVWDTSDGQPLRRLDNHTGAVLGLALRPGQAKGVLPMVASIGTDRTLRLWQPTIGRMVRLARLDSQPLALSWLKNGHAVAVACADGRVRLIDPETVAIIGDLPALNGRAYSLVTSPEGGLLVGGEHGQLRFLPTPSLDSDEH